MALSFSKTRSGVIGDLRYWVGDVTFDSTYVTNGEPLTKADFGWSGDIVDIRINQPDDAGYDVWYDHATKKLKAYDEDNTSGIAAEVANGTSLATLVVRIFAFGF